MERNPSISTAAVPPSSVISHSKSDLSRVHYIIILRELSTISVIVYNVVFSICCPRRSMDHIRRRAELMMMRVRGSGASPSWHSIPGSTYEKDEHDIQDPCSVCLSNFGDREDIRQLPICKHYFHSLCIDMWLYSHSNCPLCRQKLVAQKEDEGSHVTPVVEISGREERYLPQPSLPSTSSLEEQDGVPVHLRQSPERLEQQQDGLENSDITQ